MHSSDDIVNLEEPLQDARCCERAPERLTPRSTLALRETSGERAGERESTRSIISNAARTRILSVSGEPLFQAGWMRTVFVHYEVDPKALQAIVPFPLHLYNGRAYVSLVGFTLERMRPHFGERILEWLFRPISNHQFLNVRTYLNQGGEPGIYFLAEWLNNRCSIPFGPPLFGLPYRYGKLSYQHDHPGADSAPIHGKVIGGHAWQISLVGRVSRRRQVRALNYSCRPRLEYHGAPCGNLVPAPCTAGSLDEFLLERYVASTRWMGINRYFRIWHPPWPQIPIDVNVVENKLLTANWPLFRDARLIGGHYSPGIPDVWMGQPHVVKSQNDSARDYDYDYE